MKVLYTSPVFKNIDGTARQFMVPAAGLKTHAARDGAVLKMMALGGINAADSLETRKLMATIRRAKRKIEREGWFSTPVI
jgi:hypothetical protein